MKPLSKNQQSFGGMAQPPKESSEKSTPYEFIEIIQREQAVTEVTIQQLEEEGRLRAKRRKDVHHEENIKGLTDDFVAGNRIL